MMITKKTCRRNSNRITLGLRVGQPQKHHEKAANLEFSALCSKMRSAYQVRKVALVRAIEENV